MKHQNKDNKRTFQTSYHSIHLSTRWGVKGRKTIFAQKVASLDKLFYLFQRFQPKFSDFEIFKMDSFDLIWAEGTKSKIFNFF